MCVQTVGWMVEEKPETQIRGKKLGIGAFLLVFFFYIAPPAVNQYSTAALNLVQTIDIVRNWYK